MQDQYKTWLWAKREERQRLFTPEQDARFARKAARTGRRLVRKAKARRALNTICSLFRKPFGWFRKPLQIALVEDYGGIYYPACPRCLEPAYNQKRCCFCGQKYYWEDKK